MHLFRDPSPDAQTVIEHSFQPQLQTPTRGHGPSDAFVVKSLEGGWTVKYRVHCDPDATLIAVLRDTLQSDEDNVMAADDRFHPGRFHIGKSAESRIKWRDILEVRLYSENIFVLCCIAFSQS